MLRQPETPGMGECCWEGKEWVYSKFILQTLNSNCIHSTSVIWKGRHTMSGRIHTNIADTFLHDSSSYTQYMPHLSPHLNPCKHACVPYLILIMICVCTYVYVHVCVHMYGVYVRCVYVYMYIYIYIYIYIYVFVFV
jgi:hypothetical protein